jgi:hypothetical protein
MHNFGIFVLHFPRGVVAFFPPRFVIFSLILFIKVLLFSPYCVYVILSYFILLLYYFLFYLRAFPLAALLRPAVFSTISMLLSTIWSLQNIQNLFQKWIFTYVHFACPLIVSGIIVCLSSDTSLSS